MTAEKPRLIDVLRGSRPRTTLQEEMREMLDSLTPKERALLRKRFNHDEVAIKEIDASEARAGKS